jgi:hypothetical protein
MTCTPPSLQYPLHHFTKLPRLVKLNIVSGILDFGVVDMLKLIGYGLSDMPGWIDKILVAVDYEDLDCW